MRKRAHEDKYLFHMRAPSRHRTSLSQDALHLRADFRCANSWSFNVHKWHITLFFGSRARRFSWERRPNFISFGIAHPMRHAWWSVHVYVYDARRII